MSGGTGDKPIIGGGARLHATIRIAAENEQDEPVINAMNRSFVIPVAGRDKFTPNVNRTIHQRRPIQCLMNLT